MGRPSNSEQRRAEIVDALLKVMARQGYARATVAAIARQAGLTPGLLHYHFQDKHEVLVALVQRLVVGAEARASYRLARAGSEPRRRLEAFIDAYVARDDQGDPAAVAAWVVIGAEALRAPEVRGLYTHAVEKMLSSAQRLVLDCLRAERRSTRQAPAIAAALLAAVEGAYRVSAAAPGVLPMGFAAPTLRKMMNGLLDAQEAA
jgi:TetR/AcrR family transcriptional repressor of bet genes